MQLRRQAAQEGECAAHMFITETPDGYVVTPHDPAFEQQTTEAQRIMRKRRAALRELAK